MTTIDGLVKEFAECVIGQSDAMARGDSKAGNVLAKRYIEAFDKLRAHGDLGREALSALLSHPRADVRVMAASYLLRYCGQRAEDVLELEARGKGLTAFGAAQALQRWREGTWALDPE